MILGVGIDIVDTERWARSLDRIHEFQSKIVHTRTGGVRRSA